MRRWRVGREMASRWACETAPWGLPRTAPWEWLSLTAFTRELALRSASSSSALSWCIASVASSSSSFILSSAVPRPVYLSSILSTIRGSGGGPPWQRRKGMGGSARRQASDMRRVALAAGSGAPRCKPAELRGSEPHLRVDARADAFDDGAHPLLALEDDQLLLLRLRLPPLHLGR